MTQPENTSLSARMAARQEQLAKETTEKFDVPGWEGVLAVELRRVGYKRTKKIQSRNDRIRDEGDRDLANIADIIGWATVALYEVKGSDPQTGEAVYEQLDDTWIDLARRLEDAPDMDGDTGLRRAILFICGGDKRLHFLAQQFGEWEKSGGADTREEMRDFSTTG
jgi:hypothetical protein